MQIFFFSCVNTLKEILAIKPQDSLFVSSAAYRQQLYSKINTIFIVSFCFYIHWQEMKQLTKAQSITTCKLSSIKTEHLHSSPLSKIFDNLKSSMATHTYKKHEISGLSSTSIYSYDFFFSFVFLFLLSLVTNQTKPN